MDNKEQLKHQIELLENNIGVIKIPYNYLQEQKKQIDFLKNSVNNIEENLNHTIKGIELVEEGFQQVHKDLTNLIEA